MTSLEQLAAQVHRQALDGAVRQVAPALGVNPEELLDSRAFVTAAQGLDPASPGFAADVQAAAQGAVAANPARFATAPPAAQPAEAAPAADPAEPPQWTMEDVGRASSAELSAAIASGQMRALGVPPARRGRQ